MDIANQAGAAFRADLNQALQALAGNSSGSAAPATTYAYQFWADTGAGLLRMRNGANTAWVTLGLLGVPNFGHVLPGAVVFHAKSAAPAGYLKANGGAVSRTTFIDLFNEIGTVFGSGDGSTTFNLPELRGEFIRGWDDSRGIDASRVFGSGQASQNLAHSHGSGGTNNGIWVDAPGLFAINAGGSVLNMNRATSTASDGGTEARPRNIALLACIKY
ncbi:phage tail protein [Cupriavidus basilensis]